MAQIKIAYERNFDTLLFDSISLLLKAQKTSPIDDFRQTLSRSSILFSILLLEAAANICIDELDLEGAIYNDIDRLPTIAKFDFYLRCRFRNKKLDRGNYFVQGVRELKQIRDGFVHMKNHKVTWEYTSEDSATAEIERTQTIRIAKNPCCLDFDDAVTAMRTVHGFLNHFFSENCKFNKTKVASMLFSESMTPDGEDYFYPSLDRSTRAMLFELGIDFSYVKLV